MFNVGEKVASIVGALIGLGIGLMILPPFGLPAFVISWWIFDTPSPWAIYTFIYDKQHVAIILLVAFVFLAWMVGFKATLDEASHLAKLRESEQRLGWLKRYYLYRNRELIDAYRMVCASDVDVAEFSSWLSLNRPNLYRKHSDPLSFIPDGPILQNVSGHVRRGHTRYTSRGPVNVGSHHVRSHTRLRR